MKKLRSNNRVFIAIQRDTGGRLERVRDKCEHRSYDDTVKMLLNTHAEKAKKKTS